MRQPLRFTGPAKQATISKQAGKFFVSVLLETDDYNPHAPTERQATAAVIAEDLGLYHADSQQDRVAADA